MNRKKIGGLLLIFLLFLFPASVRAENKNVDMYLKYGFQDNVKSGSCFPLNVYLENTGNDFEGTLEISVPIKAETQDLLSSMWMSGNQWEPQRDRIYYYEKEISLEQGEFRKETLYLDLPLFDGTLYACVRDGDTILCDQELTCGLSENNSRVLVGAISSDQEGIAELDGMQIRPESGYGMEVFVKAISLEPEEIYPNPDAIAQLDVLIVDKGTEFTEEQQIALTQWKENGGFFLERDGENIGELFGAFISGDQKDSFQDYLNSMGTYSFGDEEGLSDVPVRERPSMVIYVVILGIYVLVAGPGIYLFLKKKEKQKYLWSSICVTAVIFMGVIGLLGKKTNIYAPFISYSGLYEQQENIWSETAYIGIQAPYNNPYHLYLDSRYRLRQLNPGIDGMTAYQSETAEKVTIHLGEESNKISVENVAAFTQSCFKLDKSQVKEDDGLIRLELKGDGDQVSGLWKNPTDYQIRNAVLVTQNRVAVLGDIDAGEEKELSACPLYSCGNGGMDLLMREQMDFGDYEFPDYEIYNMSSRIWTVLRKCRNQEAYLVGIVSNPDLTFQENSGYRIYGTALFQMKAAVDWTDGEYLWYPNLETYGESLTGDFSEETNLLYGKEATVDYQTDASVKLEEWTFFRADYDEEKYYFPFQGNVAMYCWESGAFEEIQDWETTLRGKLLKRYLSDDGVVRVRYLLDDTLNITDRSCMLPCIKAAGKVE